MSDLIEDLGREVHRPERVLKSSMGSPWIDHVRDAQLVDVMEPLKHLGVDQGTFELIEMDKTMN